MQEIAISRAERLLNLLEEFRRHRRPVSGETLAERLGISIRTIYRDIASLRTLGANIEGEPGLGHVLRSGFLLPPTMFADEEIDALVLGARWVAERADPGLARAAGNALARLTGVLPPDLARRMETSYLIVGPTDAPPGDNIDIAAIRRAILAEHKVRILYRDASDTASERIIWPFMLGFFDKASLVSAWCELREGIRHFRTDRIVSVEDIGERYPKRRHALVTLWRETDPSARRS